MMNGGEGVGEWAEEWVDLEGSALSWPLWSSWESPSWCFVAQIRDPQFSTQSSPRRWLRSSAMGTTPIVG